MVDLAAEAQRRAIDESVALLARVLADLRGFDAGIAAVAQRAVVVADEAGIGQFLRAQLAAEALRVPAGLHRLDDTTNDDVAALVAERRVQNPEILLAVLATFELVEDSILERAEALRTSKSNKIMLPSVHHFVKLTQSIEYATTAR